MIKEVKRNFFLLPSGKIIYANNGILGLSMIGLLHLSEGYDSMVADEYDDGELSKEDREAIAEHMIHRWRQFSELPEEQWKVSTEDEIS